MNVINVIDNDGIRIDKYLLDKFDISRNKIQKLINDNNAISLKFSKYKVLLAIIYNEIIFWTNHFNPHTLTLGIKSSLS